MLAQIRTLNRATIPSRMIVDNEEEWHEDVEVTYDTNGVNGVNDENDKNNPKNANDKTQVDDLNDEGRSSASTTNANNNEELEMIRQEDHVVQVNNEIDRQVNTTE